MNLNETIALPVSAVLPLHRRFYDVGVWLVVCFQNQSVGIGVGIGVCYSRTVPLGRVPVRVGDRCLFLSVCVVFRTYDVNLFLSWGTLRRFEQTTTCNSLSFLGYVTTCFELVTA